jgi:two-component system, response regulator PdtaR
MSARILIVEDEVLVALELEAILQDLGHEPIGIAPDSVSAYQLANATPDLALVDLNLRDGATGPEIGAKLARDRGINVLFMTANPSMLGEGVAGTVGVLTKPYDAEAVEHAVDYALRRSTKPPARLRVFNQDLRMR